MDANKRLILTVIISLGILIGFQLLFPQTEVAPKQETAEAPLPPEERGERPAERTTPEAEGRAAPRGEVPKEETVELRTDALRLVFSSHGAGIRNAELTGPKGRRQGDEDAPQVDLAGALQAGDPLLFELVPGGGLPSDGVRSPCSLVESDATSVTFDCREGSLQIRKTFELRGERTLSLSAVVSNRGDQAVEGVVDLLVPARVDPALQTSGGGCGGLGGAGPSPTRMVCRHGDDLTHRLFEAKEPVFGPVSPASFAGIEERYFLAAAVPEMPGRVSSCELVGIATDFLETHLRTPTGRLAPGASIEMNWGLYLGQKELGFLQATSAGIAAEAKVANPHLDETVDLGFWAAIARILLWMMRVFHSVLPNWGVAIILLTIAIKVITLPLTWKSMKSMEEVRKLAPEIEKLKAKHGKDREKLNVEMMQLYQRHKVNPLGGCLPMLIQMPIWLALYTTLQTSVELYNEPFIGGWIADLTSKDPYYILPLAMGATMFVTQKMQPMQMDATQQKMMLYMMPIFFTFIMLQLPAGLTLYIFTNNLLSIAQQFALRRIVGSAQPIPAAAATVEGKKREKKK